LVERARRAWNISTLPCIAAAISGVKTFFIGDIDERAGVDEPPGRLPILPRRGD
jgi:hypothetical protein